jgi:hypothetical protein
MRQWVKLKGLYYDIGNNVLEAKLFMNIGICEPGATVESNVFSVQRYETIRNSIQGTVFKDIIDRQNRVHGKMEIEAVLRIGITWVEYFRLRTVVQVRMDGMYDTGERGQNVSIMMSRGKISSSKLRKKIVGRNSGIIDKMIPVECHL